ncbi:MAG: hypothetical protein JEZ11_24075 [Desulfobacterales bacterium]|nr:hypothetical protein [Desulfobacterales bacterium]
MKKQTYFHIDSDQQISIEELKNEDKEFQIEVMKEWFSRFFENPVESTPYETKEGGYQYIWGGPYNAKEELENEFSGIVSEEAIEELVEELETESYEWSGIPSDEHYDDYYYDVIAANTESHGTLTKSLNNIRKLLYSDISEDLHNFLNMMLYVNIITTLETFLSDSFIGAVIGNDQLIRAFVKSNTDFADKKVSLNDIFDRIDSLENEVRSYLLDLIWHNLAKVGKIYKHTLNIDFPQNMKNLYEAVAKRHDIVHRSGMTKSGDQIVVTKDEIEILMDKVRAFADHIDSAWGV